MTSQLVRPRLLLPLSSVFVCNSQEMLTKKLASRGELLHHIQRVYGPGPSVGVAPVATTFFAPPTDPNFNS